jgi:hypothetical protein
MSDDLSRWLVRTSYENVEFPAVDCTTTWGHDKSLNTGLLRDGADIETTGQRAKVVHMKIGFINTLREWPRDLFPNRFRELIDVFEFAPIGTLKHPTRGDMVVHVDDVSEPIDGKVRNGVYLDVTFTERNADALVNIGGGIGDAWQVGFLPTDPPSAMNARATDADSLAVVAAPDPVARPLPILTVVFTAIQFLETARQPRSQALNMFNSLLSQIDSRMSLPSVTRIAGHDYRVAMEALRVATYAYQDSYLGTERPKTFVVPVTMSCARIAAHPAVYGDASKASLIRAANTLPDPMFVPQGTVITVLPVL